MKRLSQILDSLLYSNIFIGLCAVALTFTNQLIVGGHFYFDSTCWFIFTSTIFTYSFLKFREPTDAEESTLHQNWAMRYPQLSRNIQLISLVAMVCFFFLLSSAQMVIVVVLAIVTAFYGFIPLPLAGGSRRLRDWGLLKTIFVGIVWSVTTVAVPLANIQVEPGEFVFLLLRRFLFILGLTLVFEIKDMKGDKAHRIHTLPMEIGVVNTKLLAQAILFGLMVIITAQFLFFNMPLMYMLAFNLSLLVSILCIQPVNENTGERWYYLVLDGMMILQFVFVYGAVKFAA